MAKNFGDNLKAYRKLAGLTQTDLAKKAGTTRSSVNNYEHGFAEPSFEVLCYFADALGVEITDLVEERKSYPDYIKRVQVTDDEAALLQAFREADPIYQNVAYDILRSHKKGEK